MTRWRRLLPPTVARARKWKSASEMRRTRNWGPGRKATLFARGAHTFVGYVQGARFTEQSFTADGWLKTGDRARRDADGYIRITGRSKHIIIRGGENVPVKEIEDVLLRHPKVRNVALVGVSDERLGERGCACVVLEAGEALTLDELQR